MNIEAEKISLTKLLLETEDINVLNQVKEILEQGHQKTDFWDELTDVQKEEINLGSDQLENGEYVRYEDYIAKHRK
ncbi:hypothetical protein [Flavimarina sp. Hel_I_48]|uniref:hypothetical protein n=1 Tax=Flavimarina sp. Hel_I_48 TaxID=1392488 RepID=UPI0004DF2EDD|nr:hypothetical protein [Flavimarina sp. Hel_I_48]